jgi:molecular chaperone GrpE
MRKKKQDDTEASAAVSEETVTETAEAVEGPEPEVVDDPTSALLQKLEEVSAEATSHKERYLRTVADLENYRKRALRDKEETRRQTASSIMEDLLPVIDNFRIGLKTAESHEGGAAFAEGFKFILQQLDSALKENGLQEVDPTGEVFDPNYHESIAHLPHETIEEGHIVEVQRVGYRLQERLLRPAAVVVSSGPPPAAEEGGET